MQELMVKCGQTYTDVIYVGAILNGELQKDWNDTWKPNFEAFVEADMQVIPSPP